MIGPSIGLGELCDPALTLASQVRCLALLCSIRWGASQAYPLRVTGTVGVFTPAEDLRHRSFRLSRMGRTVAYATARQGGDIRASEVLQRNDKWHLSLTLDIGQWAALANANAKRRTGIRVVRGDLFVWGHAL